MSETFEDVLRRLNTDPAFTIAGLLALLGPEQQALEEDIARIVANDLGKYWD